MTTAAAITASAAADHLNARPTSRSSAWTNSSLSRLPGDSGWGSSLIIRLWLISSPSHVWGLALEVIDHDRVGGMIRRGVVAASRLDRVISGVIVHPINLVQFSMFIGLPGVSQLCIDQ